MRAPTFLLPALMLASFALHANAAGNGLRLPDFDGGMVLQQSADPAGGLRLRYLSSQEAHAMEQSSSAGTEFGTSYGRSSLRADWPVLGEGFRTSLGLDWSTPRATLYGGTATALDITPFLSLGWTTRTNAHSGWRLSAEIGTAFTAIPGCSPLDCSAARSPGFDAQRSGSGSGLRLNPYVNFGATYVFGE